MANIKNIHNTEYTQRNAGDDAFDQRNIACMRSHYRESHMYLVRAEGFAKFVRFLVFKYERLTSHCFHFTQMP